MAYYAGRGDYYRGDYYRRGDPLLGGLLSSLGGIVGKGLKAVGGLLAPGGGSREPGMSIIPINPGGGGYIPVPQGMRNVPLPALKPVKKPGVSGAIERLLPGGETGYVYAARRSRRMNVTNPRALRRAIRRVSGFGKIVQRIKRAVGRANTAVGNKARSAGKRRFGK